MAENEGLEVCEATGLRRKRIEKVIREVQVKKIGEVDEETGRNSADSEGKIVTSVRKMQVK